VSNQITPEAPRLVVTEDYAAMSRYAAHLVADKLRGQPDATIVVPTGATPAGFYAELATLHARGAFETARLRVFQLDEFAGVTADDPRSFYAWIKRLFLDPLGIADAQVTRLRGDATDRAAACRAYDAAIQAVGGFDIAVLGLGVNGHVGFNEPPTDSNSPTREVQLSEGTRATNAGYWDERLEAPPRALTCGMANLLAARTKLLLVAGAEKRDILLRTLTGPVSGQTPASLLRHSANVLIVADASAWPWSVPAGAVKA
jgi:glucosamine-6-phosphate deaminase